MSENTENIKLSTYQTQDTNSQENDTNTISLNYLNIFNRNIKLKLIIIKII